MIEWMGEMITAKIKKTWTGISVTLLYRNKERRELFSIGMIWGTDYSIQPYCIGNYEITILRNGDMVGCVNVDDYVCLTWQEPGT